MMFHRLEAALRGLPGSGEARRGTTELRDVLASLLPSNR